MKLFIDVHYKDPAATIYSEKFVTTIKFNTMEELAFELKQRTMTRSYNYITGDYDLVQVHEIYVDVAVDGRYLCYLLEKIGVETHQISGKLYKNVLPILLR